MYKENLKDLKIAANQFVNERKYWTAMLSGELEKTSFPYDYKKTGEIKSLLETGEIQFSNKVSARLLEISGGSNIKLHIILAAGLVVLLHKYTGNLDIIIGSPIDRQDTDSNFINTSLPLRIRLDSYISFKAILGQVKDTIAGAVKNQNFPIETLFPPLQEGTDPGNSREEFSLFTVAILLENLQDKKYIEHLNNDMIFSFLNEGRVIKGKLEFNASLYQSETVQRIISHYIALLEEVLFNVDIKIAAIDLSRGEEKRQLIGYNQTGEDFPGDKTIHELFEAQAARTPGSIAIFRADLPGIRGSKQSLTYGELNKTSNRVAWRLREKNVRQGSIVGILMERSIEFITAVLGVLKAGGAYLPIETEYPARRKKYILEDSQAALLITHRGHEKHLDWEGTVIFIDELVGEKGQEIEVDFPVNSRSGDLAYIIYTSGSTGQPKGVMVEHEGLVNYILWAAKMYVKNQAVNFPLFSSISFDLTVTSIFTPLLTGNAIVVYENEHMGNIIERIIDDNHVGVIKLTPSHMALIRHKAINGNGLKTRRFIVGGERLDTRITLDIHNNFGENIEIYNEYGPTEATVGCMIYRFKPEDIVRQSVPVGIPARNFQVYLVDRNLMPVPMGAVGEMLVEGPGVARGYLNRPSLTSEKFGNNNKKFLRGGPGGAVFSKRVPPGRRRQRTYKTGDLSRFLPDGQMEFLGRIDRQVKIRGFRIELEEIENQLQKYKGIKEAVVQVKELESDSKHLCAYIATDDSETFGQADLMAKTLREYLQNTLAEYMIPSFFIKLEKMPLTPHGKINRSALPDPDLESQQEYVPPKSVLEKELVKVWAQVFGQKKIGIYDSYFELGGDSIKAIQVAARMNEAGYKVNTQDIFQYPTISELAGVIEKISRVAEQGVITGTIPLTPIQKWFFSTDRIDMIDLKDMGIRHFNQAALLYFQKQIEEEAVKKIFKTLQDHHDVLRMSYKKIDGEIIQTNHGPDYPLSIEVVDLRNIPYKQAAEQMEQHANRIQVSIDLETGPLMKLGLYHLQDGDRLLIVIHHLVIDGVSWRILSEDIETLYSQYQNNETLRLPLKTDSFQHWSKKLYAYANSPSLIEEKTYWTELESRAVQGLKADFPEEPGDNVIKDEDTLWFVLEKEETELLLTKVNQAFGTDNNDILLTALGLGLKRIFGLDRALIALEGHGREELFDDIDINRTVGWFTSLYPVILDISHHENLSRQVKEIKETLRRIPNKGIGYWILKYLTAREHGEDIDFQLKPPIRFNYLGQFDANVKGISFRMADESYGQLQAPGRKREYQLLIIGIITEKQLRLSITFDKNQFKEEIVEDFIAGFKKGLLEIISYCSARTERELTPSDLTYKELSMDTLQRLNQQYEIDDIYPLTPLQEGMLFHTLYEESSSPVYWCQVSHRFMCQWNIPFIEDSFNVLFKRFDILRTVFIYKELARPLQVVVKNRKIDFLYKDLREVVRGSRSEKERYVKEFKEMDRSRGIDLTRDVLMRMTILQLDDLEYDFTWSFHHILMDGWCLSILISEFFQVYESLVQGKSYQLPAITPYREYIRWLEKQDKEKAKKYWTTYLAGYTQLATLPGKKARADGGPYDKQDMEWPLDKDKTAALNNLATRNQVTQNTVIQTVWGLVLGKYTGRRDVVFGSVVSGRPAELKDVETIVGTFINTIPVRIKYEKGESLQHLLHKVQEKNTAGEPYHHYSLARIQTESGLRQNLLDHIIVFENFPVDHQVSDAIEKRGLLHSEAAVDISSEDFVFNNYNFFINIFPGESLLIKLNFNARVFERELVEKIGHNFINTLYHLMDNDKIQVDELEIRVVEKPQHTLYQFNDDLEKE